jgi:hypothetical protein
LGDDLHFEFDRAFGKTIKSQSERTGTLEEDQNLIPPELQFLIG